MLVSQLVVGHIARMEQGRSAFEMLRGKPTGKRHLGRPERRWEDNIRMNLKEISIYARNWVDSAEDKGLLESPCERGNEPPGFISHEVSWLNLQERDL